MDDIIVAENLTKHYKKVQAVQSINLAVRRGEIFGLVGPDGAGKTTTMQMLVGILNPTAGRATVAGLDVVKDAVRLGEHIGYMSEGFTLYGTLSVEENLNFFADLYRVPRTEREARKQRLLAFSRLEPFRTRRAEQLSGGMQKKLALAGALIHNPRVLFLDEPTTGVDPVSRRDFWRILYDFVAEGVTVFVSTPYMDEAERCHRVALMRQGQIIRADTPAELKRTMRGVAVEIIAEPQVRAVEFLKRAEDVSQVQVFGERLHLLFDRDGDRIGQLQAQMENGGITVRDAREIVPSVENVFIEAIANQNEQRSSVKDAGKWRSGVGQAPMSILPSPTSNGNAVVISNLTRQFGDFVAVDNISLAVKRGEIFGFLGPNGSGKTTTIRMLCGLLTPTSGTGTVAGFDIRTQQQQIKPRIGYMSQRFSLYKDLTVEENIDFYAGVYEVPPVRRPERKKWVLEMAGLRGKEKTLTKDLAGGWKQRLALGCAILHEPEILFLDEPTSGVDPISRREFWDLIFNLAFQGVTVFLTTHYMDEAEHAHTLGLIYNGRLIANGSPRDLRADMRAGELIEIDSDHPVEAADVIADLPFTLHTAVFGDKVHALVEDAAAAVAPVKAALRAKDISPRAIQPVPLSLEDLFIVFIGMVERGKGGKEAS
jgi:ABC-2 type transport system ATP-binding protein